MNPVQHRSPLSAYVYDAALRLLYAFLRAASSSEERYSWYVDPRRLRGEGSAAWNNQATRGYRKRGGKERERGEDRGEVLYGKVGGWGVGVGRASVSSSCEEKEGGGNK